MMNIDDKKMITKVDSQASLFTEQIIYFGNVPRDYAIGPGVAVTNIPFIGCIGDVTVNTRYVVLNFEPNLHDENTAFCLDTCTCIC